MPSTRARTGDYKHRVEVIIPVITQDTFGQEKRSWQPAMKIWCAIEPEYRPTDIFPQTSAQHHYEQKIWFRTRSGRPFDMKTMRLRHRSEDYEILAIEDPAGANREERLLCRKVMPA
jgi:head-tail adaptor